MPDADGQNTAIHRATVTGCALVEVTRAEAWTTLLLLVRQRGDLIRKGAAVKCQIRERLGGAMPGFTACAADFATEMEPSERCANAKAISGRAGPRPCRYQSDTVDRTNGPLLRACNRSLGAASSASPKTVNVGLRLCRIALRRVAGRKVFCHLAIQGRYYPPRDEPPSNSLSRVVPSLIQQLLVVTVHRVVACRLYLATGQRWGGLPKWQ